MAHRGLAQSSSCMMVKSLQLFPLMGSAGRGVGRLVYRSSFTSFTLLSRIQHTSPRV